MSKDSLDVFPEDLKVRKCRICGHEWPPDTLLRGICEDCMDEIDDTRLGFVRNERRRGWDDEN